MARTSPLPLLLLGLLLFASAPASAQRGGGAEALPPIPAELASSPDGPALAEAREAALRMRRMRMPRISGRANMEKFRRWASRDFGPWLHQRRSALTALESIERRVGTEAGRALFAGIVAESYRDMAAEVEGAPVPREIRADPQLAEVYRDALRDAVAPVLERSRAAYELCAQRATSSPIWQRLCQEGAQALRPPDPPPPAPSIP